MINSKETNSIDIKELTARLNKEDRFNEKITKRMSYFYIGFGTLYFLVYVGHAIFDSTDFSLTDCLSGASYIIAFTMFAILFKYSNKEYREVNYALPTIQMLNKAAKRYKLFNIKLPLAIIAALFIDAGMTLNHIELPLNKAVISDIIESQTMFFSAIGIGVIAGITIWYIRQKPIRDNVLTLIKELEN